jgi:hypothetical protein
LSFPVTRTEPEFNRVAKRLGRYLSKDTIIRIRVVQPWFMAAMQLARANEENTTENLNMLISLDRLHRLNRLDHLDKHRQPLTVDFHPGTITLRDDEFDPIDQGREPEGEPVDLDELDPETRVNLIEALLKMQEYDERPDSYDFFFSGSELHDGAEIGRYIRHDRGQMPSDLTARGSLRLVLWEPELTGRFPGGPPLQKTVQEMIDEVESICAFVESGVLPKGDETTELSLPRGSQPRAMAFRISTRSSPLTGPVDGLPGSGLVSAGLRVSAVQPLARSVVSATKRLDRARVLCAYARPRWQACRPS